MENVLTLHQLGTILKIAALVIVVAYVVYQAFPFLLMALGIACAAKTIDDWLAVLLPIFVAIVLVGEYVIYTIATLLGSPIRDATYTIYIHIAPQIGMIIICLTRILWIIVRSKNQATSTVWAARSSPSSDKVFYFAGAVWSGDYLLRHCCPDFFNIPIPWQSFWLHCAAVSVITCGLAACAHRMATSR